LSENDACIIVQSLSELSIRVWQEGMSLVENIYGLTRKFPSQEMYGLSSQMQRTAVSIPSNIAEGHTGSHRREYAQYVSIAPDSISELETQVEISSRLNYIDSSQSDAAHKRRSPL
jgi:four helix bundle protein